jgi:2-polyprenyl-6-methoxyphenol hydroxylase-like FAD-dependent oxidoreductase
MNGGRGNVVVIVGGGVTGMCLAALLGASDYPVTLVEASAERVALPQHVHDPQVFALSLASQRILAHIGAWQWLDPARVGPYDRMHVWDALGTGSIDFKAAAIGEPALGYVVEQRSLLLALEMVLRECQAVTWLRPAIIESLVQHGNRCRRNAVSRSPARWHQSADAAISPAGGGKHSSLVRWASAYGLAAVSSCGTDCHFTNG